MSCCGRKRQAYREWLMAPPVRLRDLAAAPKPMAGPITGRSYEFSPQAREIDVDPRDANALIATSRFARVE